MPVRVRTPTPPPIAEPDLSMMSEEELMAYALAMSMGEPWPPRAPTPPPPRVPTPPRPGPAITPPFIESSDDYDMRIAIALSMDQPMPERKKKETGAIPKSTKKVRTPQELKLLTGCAIPDRYPPTGGPNNRTSPAPLANIGNTCYMNSFIQCLMACDAFGQAMYEAAEAIIPILGADTVAEQSRFIAPFLHLRHGYNQFRGCPQGDVLANELWQFRNRGVIQFHPPFSVDGRQQDASEMVLATLNYCDMECSNFTLDGPQNPIDRFFRIAKATFNTCNNCGHVKVEGELTTVAMLQDVNISSDAPTSVRLMVDATYNAQLDAGHMTCPGCNRRGVMVAHEGATSIGRWVFIQAPRFGLLGTKSSKVIRPDVLIKYPLYNAVNGVEIASVPLTLRAVICHIGDNPMSGHYIAFVRNRADDTWYCCDDHFIVRLRGLPNDILTNENGYIFLYEK